MKHLRIFVNISYTNVDKKIMPLQEENKITTKSKLYSPKIKKKNRSSENNTREVIVLLKELKLCLH